MRAESGFFEAFVMNMMIAMKRTLFVLLALSALGLVAMGAGKNEPCPLPISDSTMSASTQSPENQQCMRVVLHNGMRICLPCPAADAHTRVHGDADLGPCSKPGNQDPGTGH